MRSYIGWLRVPVYFFLFLIALAGQSSTGQDINLLKSGVVVESVLRQSESDKAGIQEGDILLRWTRGDVHGELRSPFDLSTAEIEQVPRGNLLLDGLREKERKTWQLGQDRWGIEVRPNFPEAALTLYRKGRDLAVAGKLSEAAEKWRLILEQGDSSNPQWLLFHLAGLQADARHWKEADRWYQEALQTSAANQGAVVQIHMAWGRSFVQRNDWEHAGEHFSQAMVAARAIGDNTLALATDFDELGGLAQKQGDLKKAEGYYQQALRVRESLSASSLATSTSLNNLGSLAFRRGDLDKAEELDQRALAMAEKISPGSLTVAQAFGSLGDVAFARGKLAKAGEYYRRSFDIYEALEQDGLGVAKALNRLGAVAWQSGDLAKAEDYFRRALSHLEKVAPDSLDVAKSLNNLGVVIYNRGDLARAEEHYRQSLAIYQRLAPGSLWVAQSLNNLGLVADDRGDLAGAEEYHRQALAMKERLAPGSLDVASSLGNLGIVAYDRGDLAKAEEYDRQALAIQEKLAPGSPDVAGILNNLGDIARERGDLVRAEDYQRRGLAIREKLAPGSLDVAKSLNYLGLTARKRNDRVEAEKYYRQALSIHEKLAPLSVDAASILDRLAQLLEDRGVLEEAEECYLKASAMLEKLAPGSADLADSLAGLASIRRRQGRLEEAARFYAQALDAFESQTARLGGTTDIRADFRAKRGNYREYMGVLLAQGKPEAAFEVLERSRARMLLEILASAHVDIRRGVSPELLKKERSLEADIKAKSERRIHLLSEKQSEEQVKAVEKEISSLTAEYQDVEARIRSSSPAYAALTQPQPLSAKEVQQQVLDADTVLLEYSLDEPRSHLFLVSSGSLEAYALPKQAVIEAASRRVYELLTARNRSPKGEKPAERTARIARADSEFPQAAAQLSRMVLGPVAGKLTNQRLLIVSDGALQYIPFAALPTPATKPSGKQERSSPLLMKYEVVNLPSASVIAALRHTIERKKPSKEVAVLADPVFSKDDVRVRVRPGSHGTANLERAEETGARRSVSTEQLTRAVADVASVTREGAYLRRLPFSRREARAIVSLARSQETMEALDFRASRGTALSPDLAQYRIVHFATHGLLDSQHPELSGLVFSLVNSRGGPQDGFVGLEDVYNMSLNADLVVLSACKTGLGREIQGEGLVGLTQGFMYAGAPRIVASLWSVDDEATAALMGRFYQAMEQKKFSPAAALRLAQIETLTHKRWNDPYYWAGFVMHGDPW